MGFFLANRKKSDSRAKRKAETAKRLEAERKQNPPQAQKKQKQTPQKPAKISVKVAEGSSVVAPKKEVKAKVAEPKPDVTGLLEALKYVDATISEVDKIKVNLLGIKAQITKFVK